jgi:hypothetical protein
MEALDSSVKKSLSEQYTQLIEFEPKFITNYVPENASDQKRAFIAGEIQNPNHSYNKLAAIDFAERYESIDRMGEAILNNDELEAKFQPVYDEFIEGYKQKTRLMELAHLYKNADDDTEKSQIKSEYMALNIELYGEPDEMTYRSLIGEKLNTIDGRQLDDAASQMRAELFNLVSFERNAEIPERFKPADETVEWMHDVATSLYENMLRHVPDQSTFSGAELKAIFEDIIAEEFGESAQEWAVDIEPAKSINVKSTEKRIVIPDDRNDIPLASARGLVVHEIGIHMLRSVMGGETNLDPLQNGLNEYYDAEEGLGVVMEQALKGKFSESGVEHYITAGLAYHDDMNFRDAYEVKWRLAALNKADESGHIDESEIVKAKNAAYGGVMRSMRGTDELPWFKDLAYYNGSVDMWRHLEENRGDDLKFMFVLLGKANAANINHERILYETKTVVEHTELGD